MRYHRRIVLTALLAAFIAACSSGGDAPTGPTASTGGSTTGPGPTPPPGPAPAPGGTRPDGGTEGGTGSGGGGAGGGGGGGSAASLNTTRFRSLTVSVSPTGGGTVSDDLEAEGSGLRHCTDCRERYRLGTRVVLTAEAAPGFTFDGWQGGDCDGRTGPTCGFTIDHDTRIVARFR